MSGAAKKGRNGGADGGVKAGAGKAAGEDFRAGTRGSRLVICRDFVRIHDRDAYLATLLAPVAAQGRLFAVWNVAADALRLPWATREPALAMIRLQWWRDVLAAGGGHAAAALLAGHGKAQGDDAPAAFLQEFLDAAGRLHGGPFADAEEVLQWGREAFSALMRALAGADAAGVRHDALAAAWGGVFVLRAARIPRRSGLPLLAGPLAGAEGAERLRRQAAARLAQGRGLGFDPALLALSLCGQWLSCLRKHPQGGCSPLRRQLRLAINSALRRIC